MTARHIYVDETKHRDYVMVAAVVLGEDLTTARAVVQDLLKPGQHHLHMKDEADGRKETIAKALAGAELRATVYDAGRRHRTQVLARAACLSALVHDLATSDCRYPHRPGPGRDPHTLRSQTALPRRA